jgi:hypothetical protein
MRTICDNLEAEHAALDALVAKRVSSVWEV